MTRRTHWHRFVLDSVDIDLERVLIRNERFPAWTEPCQKRRLRAHVLRSESRPAPAILAAWRQEQTSPTKNGKRCKAGSAAPARSWRWSTEASSTASKRRTRS